MLQDKPDGLISALRPEARLTPESGIVAVRNHAMGREGLIPLWVGEGDEPTPAFIADAANAALAGGETFYTWQRGIPELRQALARYHERHFGRPFSEQDFFVTGGGMQAIQLAIQATVGSGGEAVYLSPAWPNFVGAAGIAGATPVPVELDFTPNGWTLDHERLAAAITPRTRVLFLNSPSNPTGWTADRSDLEAVLGLARKHGLWIIADEIYTLFSFGHKRAPSFLDIMEPEDRIIFVNTFSKNWAMTGWRIGWVKAHPALGQTFENLIQYSTSGVAQFMQRGAIAALDHGDAFIARQVERAHTARDRLCDALLKTGKVRLAVPPGAFYLFFAIDGITDSMAGAMRIIDETGVGLAPGVAFGAAGEGWFRLCFHRDPAQLDEAARRLTTWIGAL